MKWHFQTQYDPHQEDEVSFAKNLKEYAKKMTKNSRRSKEVKAERIEDRHY